MSESESGARTDALRRLRHLGQDLDRLRREEDALLIDRDELILQLRQVGTSWNSIAAVTGLSRQALSKRSSKTQRLS